MRTGRERVCGCGTEIRSPAVGKRPGDGESPAHKEAMNSEQRIVSSLRERGALAALLLLLALQQLEVSFCG